MHKIWGFPDGSQVKNLPAMQEMQDTWVQSLGWEDPLEEEIATHSSILAWKSHGQRNLAVHGVCAQLNTVENSFWQRPCFWVRKFHSKGNFKGFLEESLVFVGGHWAPDTDSVCPQAALAWHYAPRATASTWVNIPYQLLSLVLKLAVISTLNGAGMKEKVERKGSLGGKHIEHLTQPTSL